MPMLNYPPLSFSHEQSICTYTDMIFQNRRALAYLDKVALMRALRAVLTEYFSPPVKAQPVLSERSGPTQHILYH